MSRKASQSFSIVHKRAGRKNYTGGGIISQSEAARQAGLSKRRKDMALRIAQIPKDVFEVLMESDNPPPLAELERLGTVSRVRQKEKDPKPLACLKRLYLTATPEERGAFMEWLNEERRLATKLEARGGRPRCY